MALSIADTRRLVLFTLGEGTDHRGRLIIQDVWAFPDEAFEVTHDYVQWLFPIPWTTEFNQFAPGLTEDARRWFKGSTELRHQQEKSLERMLAFLGLKRASEGISAQLHLNDRDHPWLNRFDHNHRWISRMIRSLFLCDQQTLAMEFQSVVISIGQKYGEVPNASLEFWRQATHQADWLY